MIKPPTKKGHLKIYWDASRSLSAIFCDLLEQAEKRQKTTFGKNYTSAVMQHLVGAKLDCVLGTGKFAHNSCSTADAPTDRVGDFLVGDVAIHVTTAPAKRSSANAGTISATACSL